MEILLLYETKRCWTIVVCVLISIVRISEAQDFRIDNQLRIQANDCYTRIAIGSRMPENAVISTVTASSLSDCEAACSANRTVCNAFSFGINSRGNGTCRIGRMDLNTRGKDLVMDSEYDVYERRSKMPHGCQHDRLLRIGFEVGLTNTSNTNDTNLRRPRINTQGNNGQPMMVVVRRPQNPFGNPFPSRTLSGIKSPQEPSFFRGGWYSPIADDGDSRLYDIINNKKNYPWKSTHNYQELPTQYKEIHNQGLHLGSGLHEPEHDYGYRETTSRGFGVHNKFAPGISGVNSEWTESTPKLNHQWTQMNPKWIESSLGVDAKWTDRDAGLNNKWTEGSRVTNSKLGRGSQVWNPKLTGSGQSLHSKWTAGSKISNSKWTDINLDSGKWSEFNTDLNPKWAEAYTGFGLKLNPMRLEVVPKGTQFSLSTTALGFGTRNQALGLEFPTDTSVDSLLEKTKRK